MRRCVGTKRLRYDMSGSQVTILQKLTIFLWGQLHYCLYANKFWVGLDQLCHLQRPHGQFHRCVYQDIPSQREKKATSLSTRRPFLSPSPRNLIILQLAGADRCCRTVDRVGPNGPKSVLGQARCRRRRATATVWAIKCRYSTVDSAYFRCVRSVTVTLGWANFSAIIECASRTRYPIRTISSAHLTMWEASNYCHPFSHRAITLENGRSLHRFQTAVLI